MLVLAVDSGSGSVKFGEAIIDRKTGETKSVDYYGASMPLAKDLTENGLMHEIEKNGVIQNAYDEKGNLLHMSELFYASPYSEEAVQKRNQSSKEIYDKYGNKFSEEIKEHYLNTMIDAIKKIKEANPSKKIGFRLIGTAALRKADNAPELLGELAQRLEEQGVADIDLKVISQKEEGIYAFKSAKEQVSHEKVVVLDAGGGSRQFTRENDTKKTFDVVGDAFSSAAARDTVAGLVKLSEGQSIYPFTGDTRASIDALKGNFNLRESEWIDQEINSGAKVVGAGNIYNSVLSLLHHNNLKSPEDKSYTKQNVEQLIGLLSNKSLDEVKKLVPSGDHAFIENILTNLMLVTATMETHNIPKIDVVKVSNSQALVSEVAKKSAEEYKGNESKKNRAKADFRAAQRAKQKIRTVNAFKSEGKAPPTVGLEGVTPQAFSSQFEIAEGSKAPQVMISGDYISEGNKQAPNYEVTSGALPLLQAINHYTGNWFGKIAGAIGFTVGSGGGATVIPERGSEANTVFPPEESSKENFFPTAHLDEVTRSTEQWNKSKIESESVLFKLKSGVFAKENPVNRKERREVNKIAQRRNKARLSR
jgi:hypothetical protein